MTVIETDDQIIFKAIQTNCNLEVIFFQRGNHSDFGCLVNLLTCNEVNLTIEMHQQKILEYLMSFLSIYKTV